MDMKQEDLFAWVVLILFTGGIAYIAHTSNWLGVPPDMSDLAAVTVPFTEIARGSQSGITEEVNYQITSTDDLKKLWKMVGSKDPLPSVNFNQSDVLAVFAGKTTVTDARIAITSIQDTDKRAVSIRVPAPCPRPSNSNAKVKETTPYQIVVVAKTALPMTHTTLSTFGTCP